MKHVIFALLLLCYGCDAPHPHKGDIPIQERRNVEYGYSISTIELDSCEYYYFNGGYQYGAFLTHKQTCKYCAQRTKKQEKP